jgi:acyl phosphate:glycerol-3-phosphate acyltransferase
MIFVAILAALIIPYAVGSIPTGYLIVKYKKNIDIRTVGSGNIGATNVKRVLGMKWFLVVLFLDALKGYLPVLILTLIFGAKYPVVPIIAGASAVIGHTFTMFLNFKGGKGVATALGVFLALAPASVMTDLLIFVIVLSLFRYISLGSILCAFLLPVFIFIYGESGFLSLVLLLGVMLASFVIYKHKDNINRLIEGTENKFEFGKSEDRKEAKK